MNSKFPSQPFPSQPFPSTRPLKTKKLGNPVGKATQVAGKRIGGALRAENKRSQARRDGRR
jgi:hypothetical protein